MAGSTEFYGNLNPPLRIFKNLSWQRCRDHRQKSPNGENYKKYKIFKIIGKVVENRSHAD